jgi:Family of unknown function (DUF6454)
MRVLALCFGLALLIAGAQQPTRILNLKGVTYHVQGIDLDDQTLWVTSVDTNRRKGYLHEFALDRGDLLRSVEVQDGERFHPGGISADASSIWMPVAEYRRDSTSVIQRRNKRTLEVEFQFIVHDHIGCIAVTPDVLIGGNWDTRRFYVWNHRGELLREVANLTNNSYQDMKYTSHDLVASGLLPDRSGAIDWLEFPSLRLKRRISMGKTDRGEPFTREGMAIRGNELLLLPEDGPSRLFSFRLDERP